MFEDGLRMIARRRYTFAVAFALLSWIGLELFAAPKPVHQYTGRLDLTLDRSEPAEGPLAAFITGSQPDRQAALHNPAVLMLAAKTLREQPDLFPQTDLTETEGTAWARFQDRLREGSSLQVSEPDQATVTVVAATAPQARAIAKALTSALLQHLRGTDHPFPVDLSEPLARALHAERQAEAAWTELTRSPGFAQKLAAHQTNRTAIEELDRNLVIALQREPERRQELMAEMQKLVSAVAGSTRQIQDNVRRLTAETANWAAQINRLRAERPGLTAAVALGTPLAEREQALRETVETTQATAAALKVKADLTALAPSDRAITTGYQVATTEKVVGSERGSGRAVGAIVGALLLAGAIALVRGRLADRRAPGEAREPAAVLDYDVLAHIPFVDGALTPKEASDDERAATRLDALRDRLKRRGEIRQLWVTSARRWEGKTTVAVGLAESFAREGCRVLLVDANIHNPQLQHLFDLENQYGLTTLLEEDSKAVAAVSEIAETDTGLLTLADLIASTPIDNLSVLPGGPPPLDPNYRSLPAAWKAVHRQALALADLIIYDGDTLSRQADAEKRASYLENLLIVIAPGDSHALDVVSTNYVFQPVREAVIGAVLNRDQPDASSLTPTGSSRSAAAL